MSAMEAWGMMQHSQETKIADSNTCKRSTSNKRNITGTILTKSRLRRNCMCITTNTNS